jgi:hypothetical protein
MAGDGSNGPRKPPSQQNGSDDRGNKGAKADKSRQSRARQLGAEFPALEIGPDRPELIRISRDLTCHGDVGSRPVRRIEAYFGDLYVGDGIFLEHLERATVRIARQYGVAERGQRLQRFCLGSGVGENGMRQHLVVAVEDEGSRPETLG